MIPFDFDYYKPKTIQEATVLFHDLKANGREPAYFSGGTEIITLGRLDLVYTDAVIDLNTIPHYKDIYFYKNKLVIGAGTSLTTIEEVNKFPLLAKTVNDIADHTSRNKITIGGNICGDIYYREAVLPLLISDSLLGIVTRDGLDYYLIHEVFDKEIQLQPGDFLFNILVDQSYLDAPYVSIKRRKQWDIGYPLVTVASLKKEGQIRMAFSGVCPFPFRSLRMEKRLNDERYAAEERVKQALQYVPEPILDDVEGSPDYRRFVLQNTMLDVLHSLEGGQHDGGTDFTKS